MSARRAQQATMDIWRPVIGSPRRLTADDVMTARDVAQLLHAPVSTVEDWARRGIVPSVKLGRRRLYLRSGIEDALTANAWRSERTHPIDS
jgi:excisionase family DNA binding protein